MAERLLTKAEVAERYGVSTKTVEHYVAAGRIPKPIEWGNDKSRRRWVESTIDRHILNLANPEAVQ